MIEQDIPSREKLPLDYPWSTAIRIYAARLGMLLVVVLANLIAFVALYIIPNWIAPILQFLILISVTVYVTPRIKKVSLARREAFDPTQRPHHDLSQGILFADSTLSIVREIALALAGGLVATSLLLLFRYNTDSPHQNIAVGELLTETRIATRASGTASGAVMAEVATRMALILTGESYLLTIITATPAPTPQPTLLVGAIAPTSTPWWLVYSPPPCRVVSGRVTELPCLYEVQENDSWSRISEVIYGTSYLFVLLQDLNRLDDNGKYRPLYASKLIYIPDVNADTFPSHFPVCDDVHPPPCLHILDQADSFSRGDTYESIAQLYFWGSDEPIDKIASCIAVNNVDASGNPYDLHSPSAPTYITIPVCP